MSKKKKSKTRRLDCCFRCGHNRNSHVVSLVVAGKLECREKGCRCILKDVNFPVEALSCVKCRGFGVYWKDDYPLACLGCANFMDPILVYKRIVKIKKCLSLD